MATFGTRSRARATASYQIEVGETLCETSWAPKFVSKPLPDSIESCDYLSPSMSQSDPPSQGGLFVKPNDAELAEMRKAVRHQLTALNVHQEIHNVLLSLGDGVMEHLQKGIVPPEKSIEAAARSVHAGFEQPLGLTNTKSFLRIKVLGGKAFTDYLGRPVMEGEMLALDGELFGQRFRSTLVPACTEPDLQAEVLIELPVKPGSGAEALQLLSNRQSLHLTVVQSTPVLVQGPETQAKEKHPSLAQVEVDSSRRVAYAFGVAEWRAALTRTSALLVNVQLGTGPGAASGGSLPASALPAGIIQLQLELCPPLRSALDEPLLSSQQRTERARDAQTSADFIRSMLGSLALIPPSSTAQDASLSRFLPVPRLRMPLSLDSSQFHGSDHLSSLDPSTPPVHGSDALSLDSLPVPHGFRRCLLCARFLPPRSTAQSLRSLDISHFFHAQDVASRLESSAHCHGAQFPARMPLSRVLPFSTAQDASLSRFLPVPRLRMPLSLDSSQCFLHGSDATSRIPPSSTASDASSLIPPSSTLRCLALL
eukprot:gene7055-151_t